MKGNFNLNSYAFYTRTKRVTGTRLDSSRVKAGDMNGWRMSEGSERSPSEAMDDRNGRAKWGRNECYGLWIGLACAKKKAGNNRNVLDYTSMITCLLAQGWQGLVVAWRPFWFRQILRLK